MRVPVRAIIVGLVVVGSHGTDSRNYQQKHGCDQPQKGHSKNKSIEPRDVPQLFSSSYFFHVY